jgi:hypothetical protein
MKKLLVNKFIDFTDGWNHEIHEAIEAKIKAAYKRDFSEGAKDPDGVIKRMREFYYQRMMTTASLIITIASLVVSIIALIVSFIALK